MQIPQSFFFRVLKPGRYLGGEPGSVAPGLNTGRRAVAWYYPGRYEDAIADAGFRRGYFALNSRETIACARAVEFATDLWHLLADRRQSAFTIDGHVDFSDVDDLVFWVPDVFAAAHIPSILKRLKYAATRMPRCGALIGGCWVPNFFRGQLDWIACAPHGWITPVVGEILSGGDIPAGADVFSQEADNWADLSGAWPRPTRFLPSITNLTPQLVPITEAGNGFADVELVATDELGRLSVRGVMSIVEDALEALRTTGAEGIRLCDSGVATGPAIPTVLFELTRVHNMARVQVDLPAVSVREFEDHWRAFKPHLTKPILRLRITSMDDEERVIALGREALNAGWHGVTLVLSFDSFASFSALAPTAVRVTDGWVAAASGFEDRRPIRIEYEPAGIETWIDPPSDPSETDFRRLAHECRHLRESVSNTVAVPGPHIEAVIARNWLSAAGTELWSGLAELDLSDPNDESRMSFDWLAWLRQGSGLHGPPTLAFTRSSVSMPVVPAVTDSGESSMVVPTAQPADSGLYGRRKKRPVFSRRLQAPTRTRLRVQWGKNAAWRLYSHLDMVRVIERAIRKSGIPVQYSEGFHPRMKVSFGPPLTFGLTSRAELLDILLDRGVEDSDAMALQGVLPDGVTIVGATGFPAQVPSLTETINEAEYSALLPLGPETAQECIQRFLSQPEIRWVRPDRPDRKPIDPRATLRATELEVAPEGVRWTLTVSIGGPGGARPGDWAAMIFQLDDDQIAELVIERTALRVRQNETVRSPLETVPV